jgi:hypothetical protein
MEITRDSPGIHTDFAWKSHKKHENHGKTQKLHGIRTEVRRKSHENHESHGKSQKLRGTRIEITQNCVHSRGIRSKITRNSQNLRMEIARKSRKTRKITEITRHGIRTEFIGFRMGPRPRGHPSSPRRVPPPSSAALAPRPPPTPGSPALSPFPLFSVSLPRLLHPSRPCLRSENPHGPKGQ